MLAASSCRSTPASSAPRMPMAMPRPAQAISTRAATAPTIPMARCSTAITRARCSAASAMTWPTISTSMSRATAAESYSFGWYFPQKIQPGTNQADIFYKNNPFLTAAEQTALGNNGTNPTQLGATQAANTFQLGEFLVGNGQTEINATGSVNRVLSMRTGLDGTIMDGRFNWDLFYQPWREPPGGRSDQQPEPPEHVCGGRRGADALGHGGLLCRHPSGDGCAIRQLRAVQSFRPHFGEPVGVQIRLPDHGFPRNQHPGQCGWRHLGQGPGRLGRSDHRGPVG